MGYLSYDSRLADLFFEVITRRYQKKPVIITTDKPFGEWTNVFPNAGCVVTLVDRLMHKAELLNLEGKATATKRPRNAPPAMPNYAPARNLRKPDGDPKSCSPLPGIDLTRLSYRQPSSKSSSNGCTISRPRSNDITPPSSVASSVRAA